MPPRVPEIESQTPALQAFLLGQVDFERNLALQQRLLAEALDRDDGQITLLLSNIRPSSPSVGAGRPANWPHKAACSAIAKSRSAGSTAAAGV